MPPNEVLTDEMEPQRVKKRRIGSTNAFTIPALFRNVKAIGMALKKTEPWEVKYHNTPEAVIIEYIMYKNPPEVKKGE